jgi:hypothetical protein
MYNKVIGCFKVESRWRLPGSYLTSRAVFIVCHVPYHQGCPWVAFISVNTSS